MMNIVERLRVRNVPYGWLELADNAADEINRLEEALQRIVQWSEAYPLDIFPEPDWAKARQLLEAGGITLDAVSAHNMRHVVESVGKIAREALEDNPG
jgi:hypothetical protein